jgi:hypothetical protein
MKFGTYNIFVENELNVYFLKRRQNCMSGIEIIVHLTDDYERALNNAAQWRIDIERLLHAQKDKRFVEIIKERE